LPNDQQFPRVTLTRLTTSIFPKKPLERKENTLQQQILKKYFSLTLPTCKSDFVSHFFTLNITEKNRFFNSPALYKKAKNIN
jgi:hypothetical protein